MTPSSSSGPLPQLPPTASAPHARRATTACSGETPIIVWPRVSKVIVAMSGIAGATRRTPSIAALISLEVGHRLDPDQVHAAGHERGRLLGEDVDRLVVVERAERGHDLAARADVAGHERAWPPAGVDLGAEEDRGGPVELVDAVLEAVQPEPEAVAAERVGEQDPRTGLEVAAMDPADDLGLGQVPDLGRVAELETGREEHRAHRPVGEDRSALVEQGLPALRPRRRRRRTGGRPRPGRPAGRPQPSPCHAGRPGRRRRSRAGRVVVSGRSGSWESASVVSVPAA